jgi:2-hydroxychromene-2-carboxylate isomerase
MTKTIDLYIDIISPFSYLAHTQLPKLASTHGYTLAYHPIDIPSAKMAAGNYGPSNREVPAKIAAIKQDLERWAQRYGVVLTTPKGFNGLRWNIGVLYAQAAGSAEGFVREAYERVWAQGIDPADTGQLVDAARAAGLDVDPFLAYVQSTRGETDFRKACVEAHRRGVFGAPIMMVAEQVWWGNDRLDFLEEYLKSTRSTR